MPLTKKGKKIKNQMTETYGKKNGLNVFYASINKGKVKGAEKKTKNSKAKRRS
tara:strand:+ start:1205 stop:1363 length:159 start_codon:yes stop_codon:yes gene_type:complete